MQMARIPLKSLIATGSLLLLAAGAKAEITLCQPIDTATRVLSSPSPNDIHPNWAGGSFIGTSWNLVKYGSKNKDGLQFIKGKLLPPFRQSRGYTYEQYINSRGEVVWGISSEWECN